MTFDPGRPCVIKPAWRGLFSGMAVTRSVPRHAGPRCPNFRLARAFGGPGADTPKDDNR